MALACCKIIYYLALLGDYTEQIGTNLPTFRGSLEMRPIGCLEMSGNTNLNDITYQKSEELIYIAAEASIPNCLPAVFATSVAKRYCRVCMIFIYACMRIM